jgi:hypothetical protein
MINLLDEKFLHKVVESAGARIWKGFITFGWASAGILAVIIIARLVKLIIDIIIHGYALHDFYGCGIHLLYATGAQSHILSSSLLGQSKRTRRSNPRKSKQQKPIKGEKSPELYPSYVWKSTNPSTKCT